MKSWEMADETAELEFIKLESEYNKNFIFWKDEAKKQAITNFYGNIFNKQQLSNKQRLSNKPKIFNKKNNKMNSKKHKRKNVLVKPFTMKLF